MCEMKAVLIIAIAFVLLIPFSAFAQEESLSELAKRLDAENLQKAEEQFGSNIQQQESIEMIDCPNGYTQRAISGGEIICVNEVTGQPLDTDSIRFTDDQIILGSVIILSLIIIYAVLKKKSSSSEPEQVVRRGWTEIEKEQVRIRQDGKCAKCQRPPPRWEYHHIDGDRSNNSIDNCEGLCPNCHSIETHEGSG